MSLPVSKSNTSVGSHSLLLFRNILYLSPLFPILFNHSFTSSFPIVLKLVQGSPILKKIFLRIYSSLYSLLPDFSSFSSLKLSENIVNTGYASNSYCSVSSQNHGRLAFTMNHFANPSLHLESQWSPLDHYVPWSLSSLDAVHHISCLELSSPLVSVKHTLLVFLWPRRLLLSLSLRDWMMESCAGLSSHLLVCLNRGCILW